MEKNTLIKKSTTLVKKLRGFEKPAGKLYDIATISIFNQVSDAVLLLDQDLKILTGNPAFTELWGYSLDEVRNKTPDFLYGNNHEFSKRVFPVDEDGNFDKICPMELKYFNRRGDMFYCESLRTPVIEEQDIIGYLDIHRNITERKNREEEVQKAYKRFHDIIFCSGDWVWEINTLGYYTYIDGKIEELLGYKPSEILGKTLYFLIPQSEEQKFREKFDEIVLHKQPIVDLECWHLTCMGERKRILTNGVPIFDNNGNLSGYRGVHKDITEKYHLTHNVNILASFPGQNPFPVLRIAKDGTILYCNASGNSILKLWKLGPGDKVGEDILTLVSDTVKVNFPCNFEISDDSIYYAYTIVPVTDADYVNLYFYEITDRKKAEEALSRSEERYRLAQKAAHIGNWEWNISDNSLFWSDVAESIFGIEGGFNVTFDDFMDKIYFEDREAVQLAIYKSLKNHAEYEIEHRIVLPNGEIRWVHESAMVARNFSGKAVRMVGIVRDITEYKKYEEELLILSRGMEQSPAIILFTDTDGNIQYVNPKFTQITGFKESEALGKNPRFMKSGLHSVIFYKHLWETISAGNDWHGEMCNLKKNGDHLWLLASISPIIDKQGKIIHFLFTGEDITERHHLEENMKFMALHDTLTGLPNRIYLRDRLEQVLNRSTRTHKKSALIYIDLDKFKPINDKYGHAEGDNVLVLVADRIRSCLRKMDTAARLGGDEFAVVLEDLDNEDYAMTMAHRLLNCLTLPIAFHDGDYCLGASIGIAISPDHGEQIDTLIANADKAMYAVKNSGRNNIRLYEG